MPKAGTTVPHPGGRLSGLFAGIFASLPLRSCVGSSCPVATGRTSPQEDRRTCFSRVGRADGRRKDRADKNLPKRGRERHRSVAGGRNAGRRSAPPANPRFLPSDGSTGIRKSGTRSANRQNGSRYFRRSVRARTAQANSASTFFITSAGSGSIGKTTDGRR